VEASTHQEAILDFVRRGTGHGLVEATAGSGKTTTLVMVARLLVEELGVAPSRVVFLAFNRSAAAQLRARLPAGVDALTLHALGRRVLVAAERPVELNEEKYVDLAAASGAPAHAHNALAAAARFARLDLAPAPLNVEALRARYALELPLPSEEAASYLDGMLDGATGSDEVDFTDLLYLPVRFGLRVPSYDFVCVDEAQDMSRLSLGFVLRLVEAGARALFVGDASQAIYGFAGADAASLERVAAATKATRLPLSVSYRCPTSHVVLARRLSPHMLPAPGAITGRVRLASNATLVPSLSPGDLVLSRTNGPLLDLALRVAASGVPVVVLGDDRLAEAGTLVTELAEAGSVDRQKVQSSLEAEVRRLEREMPLSLELPRALDDVRHRHQAVAVALAAARSSAVAPVKAALLRLFDVARVGPHVLLSTVHKAKGREADRVFLLAPEELGIGGDLRPTPIDTGQDGKAHVTADQPVSAPDQDAATIDDRSEANVLFVALTRAKRDLFLVEKEPGSIRRRLQEHQVTGAPGWLARWWDDVLRLTLTMSGRKR